MMLPPGEGGLGKTLGLSTSGLVVDVESLDGLAEKMELASRFVARIYGCNAVSKQMRNGACVGEAGASS